MAESGSISIQDKTTNPDIPNDSTNQELNASIEKWSQLTYEISQLSELVKEVRFNDILLQHHGIIGIKKLVSQEPSPIQEVIDTGIVPRLIEFMQNDKEIYLQTDSTQIVANLLSGTKEQTKAIIDLAILPVLVKLLKSPNARVVTMAAFALGNIAAESSIYRDMVLNQGALEILINVLATTQDLSVIKDSTFAISNLCRGKPVPNVEIVSQAIPVICAVIKKEADPDALLDALMALDNLSMALTQIQAVIATGVVPSLIKHLQSGDKRIAAQCLKILGNIITGDDQQTEFVISFPEFLPQLFQLAQHQKQNLRREACWTISNITAGNPDQVNTIMTNPEYVRILIHIATTDALEVKREAVWALSNATANHGNTIHLPQATKMEIFDCLANLLDQKDAKMLTVILEGIENLLRGGKVAAENAGSGQNEFVIRLEEKGGLDKLEQLQAHENEDVYEKSLRILETYFVIEEL